MGRLQDVAQRKVPIHITVDTSLLGEIDETALQLGETRSELVRRMITDGLRRQRRHAPEPRLERIVIAGRQFTYTAERDGAWWGAQVEELPGCWSQGKTLAELREMVADAIESVLIARGDIPDNAVAPPAG